MPRASGPGHAAVRAPHAFDLLGVKWSAPAKVTVACAPAASAPAAGAPGCRRRSADAPDARPRFAAPARCGPGARTATRCATARRHAACALDFVRARFGRVSPARAAARAAAAGQPSIIPRAHWAGNQCPDGDARVRQVQMAFVHHTAAPNDYAPADSPAIVLAHLPYHRDANGWNDIGYNFLVDRFGAGLRGPRGRHRPAVVGAQAQGYNARSDRHLEPRDLRRRRPDRGRAGRSPSSSRGSSVARRARAGGSPWTSRGGGDNNATLRPPHDPTASPATATAMRPTAPATRSTPSCPRSAASPPARRRPAAANCGRSSACRGCGAPAFPQPAAVTGQLVLSAGRRSRACGYRSSCARCTGRVSSRPPTPAPTAAGARA